MSPGRTIGAVILAAGFGRRFGSDKRLQTFGERTVAETTVDKYCSIFDAVRVVLRPEDDRLRRLLAKFPCELVIADDAHLGMGHSLAAGVGGLTWDWLFVALLDMPFIDPATLQILKDSAAAAKPDAIVRPRLIGAPDAAAHPIGFPRCCFAALADCHGDEGARAVLQANADLVISIDVADSGVVRDIDTPADLPD